MKKLAENQEWQLTVEFINKVKVPGIGGKVLRATPSGKRYAYTGVTKSEAITKAKKAGRYNASYSKTFEIVEA